MFLFEGRNLISFVMVIRNDHKLETLRNFLRPHLGDIAWKVFLCRFVLQFGFQVGAMSMEYLGSGTNNVFRQTGLLFVGGFRYIFFREKMTSQQIIHAFAVCILAIAFKIEDATKDENNDYTMGMSLVMISMITVSFMFVINELVLKRTLASIDGWEKQLLFALVDIPAQICILAFTVAWERYYLQRLHRTWNFFEHMNLLCGLMALTNIAYGMLMLYLFDMLDSLIVNLLFVVATALTWPIQVFMGFEKFQAIRLLILIVITLCCVGYQFESNKMKTSDAKIEEDKTATSELQPIP